MTCSAGDALRDIDRPSYATDDENEQEKTPRMTLRPKDPPYLTPTFRRSKLLLLTLGKCVHRSHGLGDCLRYDDKVSTIVRSRRVYLTLGEITFRR